MSDFVPEAHEVARSFDVFTDPTTYAGFDITSEGKRMLGCVDPRDEEAERLRVIVQTGGGGAGKGLDSGLALTAYETDGTVYDIVGGMDYDSELEHATVPGGHRNVCRFILGLTAITSEMIAPSEFTSRDA